MTALSVITDWRTCEDDLPDVTPGEEFERVITPQKFVVLHQILLINALTLGDMVLVHLRIGGVEGVPFELKSNERACGEGPVLTYRLKGLDNKDLKRRLVDTGAAVATRDSIAISPGLDVRLLLRNEGRRPAKPRAALVVQEEVA